jgi:hypothetical protein
MLVAAIFVANSSGWNLVIVVLTLKENKNYLSVSIFLIITWSLLFNSRFTPHVVERLSCFLDKLPQSRHLEPAFANTNIITAIKQSLQNLGHESFWSEHIQ